MFQSWEFDFYFKNMKHIGKWDFDFYHKYEQ